MTWPGATPFTQNCALIAAQHSSTPPVWEPPDYIHASDAQFFPPGAAIFFLVMTKVLHVQRL